MLALPGLLRFRRAKLSTGLEQDLDQARLAALVAQAPLLYAVLCAHLLAISFSFVNSAPPLLTYYAPSVMLVLMISRAAYWRSRRHRPIPAGEARAALLKVNIFAAFFGLLVTAWSLALFAYGDLLLRSQLVYAVAISDMVCIFALAQSPKTALMLGGMTLPGFLLLLGQAGAATTTVMAVDLMLIGAFLASMVVIAARDFETLVGAQRRAVELAAENIRLANTDSLTGLPNRREFFAALREATSPDGQREALAMGVIDLDGFKPINDIHGHVIGDRVLRECAARAEKFANETTIVARLGGDEFGIILRGEHEEGAILALGAQICAALRAPIRVAEIRAGVSASIGFARFPKDAGDGRRLYERADFALYFAKQHHRGEAVLFAPEHESKMRMTAWVEQSLRRADLNREISLVFQPLFHVGDQTVAAFEALARWSSPELGAVSPDDFIPVAERGDLIHALTRTVMRKALRAARDWPSHVSLGFNLSIRDLLSPSALAQIIAIIETSGFEPARIDIEVTELALISDFAKARDALFKLKRLGVKISLDDFGAGYSSLSYVHRLPLDKIKIDRSFVQELQSEGPARDIIRSMIALCGALKLQCVTEGVETSEQYDLLRSYGVNMVQGFLFGRPIAEADVPRFIEEAQRKALAGKKVA